MGEWRWSLALAKASVAGLRKRLPRPVAPSLSRNSMPIMRKTWRKEIRATGARAIGYATDVGNATSAQAAVAATIKEFGRLDILVNNAGIFSTIKMQPFTEIPLDDWEKMLRVNITGPFLMARAAAPVMQKQNFGRIINMGSASVSMGRPNYLHYTTSKSSLAG